MRNQLLSDATPVEWTRRAAEEQRNLRTQHDFLHSQSLTSEPDHTSTWWTFAGLRANVQLAHALETRTGHSCTASNISIDVDGLPAPGDLEAVLDRDTPLAIPESAIEQATKESTSLRFNQTNEKHWNWREESAFSLSHTFSINIRGT